MDILTLVGLVAGVLIVVLAMLANASILTFFNLPGLAIVLGGTFAVTLIKFRLPSVMSAFRLAFSAAFKDRVERPAELIREVGTLALVVRKEGILGLENHATKNEFLQKAINLCVDGHPPELVEEALAQETQQTAERYEVSERVFRGIGESAPAIGMLGTLVGLVQMLNTLDDPSSIGPAMAIALLTTLYGAFIAQLIGKLHQQDAVLGHQANEHHEPDLRVDVNRGTAQEQRKYRRSNTKGDDQRDHDRTCETLELRTQD